MPARATDRTGQRERPHDEEGSPEARLRAYLRRRVRAEGEFYCKSKFVADEVDLSPSQIGCLMGEFADSAADLDVERWGYTNATTWRVAPASS